MRRSPQGITNLQWIKNLLYEVDMRIRHFKDKAGTFTDYSVDLRDYKASTNQILIDTTNDSIDFVDSVGTQTASITQKVYKDVYELGEEIQGQMNSASTDTYTVQYDDSTGFYTIASTGTTFELLFAAGVNNATSAGSTLGYFGDQTGALTYTGTSTPTRREVSTALIDLDPGDYYYIGQRFPFNHLYFIASDPNLNAANMTIEYWDGTRNSGWKEVVEITDETEINGVPFAQEGYLSWVPNKRWNWTYDDTVDCNGNEEIDDMGAITVYDQYWIRISFDAAVSFKLSWAGNLFNNDIDLYAEYPSLNSARFLTSWDEGKTTWQEQAVNAAKVIIRDLKEKNVVWDAGQILERDEFRLMSVNKTAEIIMSGLGDNYVDDTNRARQEYHRRFTGKVKVDKAQDGIQNRRETYAVSGILSR